MKAAIQRRDSAIEPLDLLPRTVALGRCLDEADRLDGNGRAYCEKQSAAVAELKVSREKLAREMEALRQSRDNSGR